MDLSDQVSQRLRKYNYSRDDANYQLRQLKASHGCLRFLRRRLDMFTDKTTSLQPRTCMKQEQFGPKELG